MTFFTWLGVFVGISMLLAALYVAISIALCDSEIIAPIVIILVVSILMSSAIVFPESYGYTKIVSDNAVTQESK